jgi:hypothetical protein
MGYVGAVHCMRSSINGPGAGAGMGREVEQGGTLHITFDSFYWREERWNIKIDALFWREERWNIKSKMDAFLGVKIGW